MQFPVFPAFSADIIHAIADRHGLRVSRFSKVNTIGVYNAIYLLDDDWILRVPREHPHFIAALLKEAVAVPAARTAGVATPRLVAFDDSRELLSTPYAIYERVRGEPLEQLGLDPAATPGVYRALGRDLARLHLGVTRAGDTAGLGAPNLPLDDPMQRPDELAAAGYFSTSEARWLTAWLRRLPPLLSSPETDRFLHGDTQASNILVRPGDAPEYVAIIDWGGCGWGDPALDFSGMPLRAVPDVLAGYRELARLPDDATAEARILRYHLQIALVLMEGPPRPVHSWGERPLSYMLDLMRFLLDSPDPVWAGSA